MLRGRPHPIECAAAIFESRNSMRASSSWTCVTTPFCASGSNRAIRRSDETDLLVELALALAHVRYVDRLYGWEST